jgi:hypothetical protein
MLMAQVCLSLHVKENKLRGTMIWQASFHLQGFTKHDRCVRSVYAVSSVDETGQVSA